MKPKSQPSIDEVNQALSQAKGGFSAKGDKEKPDAYINISIIDAQGNAHAFSRGYNPVEAARGKLDRSLYNKAKANGGEVEITVKAVVRIAEKDDGTDLEL